jgi:hypothetical protein
MSALHAIPGESVAGREPVLILDPRDPMRIARELVARNFTDCKEIQTLHQHRGSFWQHRGSHYVLTDDKTIQATAWTFLEGAMRPGEKKQPSEPFKPKRAHVFDVVAALEAVTALDAYIGPPVWLCDTAELPPACEFFAAANGLLHLPSGELYQSTPNYFGLSASEVLYDPDTSDPIRWLTFLAELFAGDPEAIE